MLLALLAAFCVLLLLAWALAPRGVPWANSLTRINPGAGDRAEWTAPPAVTRTVKREYLSALAGLDECAADWGLLATELERLTAGSYRQRQQAALALLVQTPGPRLASRLSAEHHLGVRHFSADGLRCLVIDRQKQRLITTANYWTGRPVHRQRLPDANLVVQMVYDTHDRRWKIERLVQTLPAPAPSSIRVTLTTELPTPAGRDH